MIPNYRINKVANGPVMPRLTCASQPRAVALNTNCNDIHASVPPVMLQQTTRQDDIHGTASWRGRWWQSRSAWRVICLLFNSSSHLRLHVAIPAQDGWADKLQWDLIEGGLCQRGAQRRKSVGVAACMRSQHNSSEQLEQD